LANSFFPSGTITWYMARMFVVRTFAIMFALVLVLQTLDLLGESGKILAWEGNDSGDVWHYVSLRAPQIIAFILPFSVLFGTVITLGTLNQNSEVISMKGAGLSAHQVLAPLLVAALAVALVSFAFNDRIVSRATATLNRWQKAEYGPMPKDMKAQVNVWVRDDADNLINAHLVHGRGAATVLEGVTIYNRGSGKLDSIVSAAEARTIGNEWQLEKARRFDVVRGTQSDIGTIRVGAGVKPDQFTLANVNANEKSFRGLWQAINDLKEAGRPTGELEAGMWHKISGPLSALLMPLLGAVAAFGIARSGKLFVRAVIAMGLGFAYFVADNFGLAMGNLGAYPPLLAAWGPFLLFLLIGEAVLVNTEE
jgi:lipopolysaccharide export system permease protein